PPVFHIDIDVAVEVSNIQQLFQVVGCDLALFLQGHRALLDRARLLLAHRIGPLLRCGLATGQFLTHAVAFPPIAAGATRSFGGPSGHGRTNRWCSAPCVSTWGRCVWVGLAACFAWVRWST